ncbi:hypothetical protein MACK_002365 [Theileria orientalis]|uniref:Uncharacterized protein n=1 Tax=Theileria orientalis TaxID=68886 RepID=A0A976MC05_THEOR|nr:hypothetical protein MACK_002365 [Theileria orientalis]
MDDGLKNENVSTQGPDNVGEGKFKKVTMRPNTDDAKEGSSVGPWRVYNTKLLTKEPSIKIQPSTLLDDITTGDTGRIENSGKKYSSITVFYTSENKALLVEFDQVGGTKTYFRRKNKEGNTWASDTGIKTSPDGQLAKTLTDIANEAQIIVDSPGDGATEVQIQTSRTGSYQGGGGQVTVEVTEEKHWDKLSKIFKRYRHAINYKDDGGVYNIALIGSGVKSEFTYENPNVRVKAVQVFFKGDAKPGKDNPLVVGFVYDKGNTSGCNGNKCYYSWTALKSTRTSTGDIVRVESISEKDLINGLLEEIGNTSGVRGRMNKLVVRISEQPNNGQATYPESAYFKDKGDRKITVTKQQVSGLTGYVGYEHSFAGVNSGLADDLYVSYGNNSRFFQTGTSAKIQNVTAYYEDDSNPVSSEKKLVLITFKLTNGSIREHKYYDFVSELKGIKDASSWSTDVKKLSGLQTLSVFIGGGSNLKTRLPEETERLRQLIAFQKGGADNQNVTTSGPNNVGSDKFIKYTMTPNKQDPDVPNKRSVGPWYVYNNKLLTKEPKNKALLVEFDQVGGTKTYFRRKNKEGNTWAKETGISSGGVDAGKLNNIRTEAGVTTTRGTSSIQPGNGSRDAKRIDIYTNKTGTYSGDAKINVNLTEEQWDPLSKVFKVYKHAIQYPGGGSSGYNPSDYNIRVTGPGESGSQFGYTWPTKKVTEVEVFFKGTASPGNTDPLVVGFVYGDDVVHGSEDCKKSNSSKCYYSWSQLKDKDSTNAITNVDSVIEKDLVTVLLEMIGTSHNRQDKLVIRLGEQPASSSSNYPGTGKNKNEITVKKQFVSGDSRFVKYEHTFTGVTVNGVEGFYVSYEKNSRFIMTGLESMSGQVTLEKVAVYYKAAGASPGGTDKPLLIVFHFKGVVGTYEYRYSEFNEELQGLSGGSNWLGDTKIIGELTSTNAGGRSDSELISILQQESGSGSQGDSTAATVGGAVGGVAGVGGIAGIAIYKNFAAVTGLIGRLF